MVLVITVVFTMVVGAIAGLVATGLRYGQVVENRADRLAAADGGLRYGVERLRNFESLCTTRAGTGGGFTTIFPPQLNGADTSVTCRRVGGDISDVQGWGVVITGANAPASTALFTVSGSAAGDNKKLRGPVYVSDVENMDFTAELIINDGDLHHFQASCATSPVIPAIDDGWLTFDPSFLRGLACSERTWAQTFGTPTRHVPTPQALSAPAPFNDTAFPGCRVHFPGKYTSLSMAADNYFVAGDYYFENIDFDMTLKKATFGFPGGTAGDEVKVPKSTACGDAMIFDRTTSGDAGGATLWVGGSTHFTVGVLGELEIFRRQQWETYLSIFAVKANGVGFIPSNYTYVSDPVAANGWLIETLSGATNDLAIHGLVWAPDSRITLGNITQSANGQMVGGLVISVLDIQASASADEFAIGVEGNPVETDFLLESTATKDGQTTSIRTVVNYRPDSRQLAVTSWRVSDN